MKRLFCLVFLALFLLAGCGPSPAPAQVVATTLPVYDFTVRLCQNTPITVSRLITQDISCLHDYTLTVSQAMAIEGAELVVISGGGLEDLFRDALRKADRLVDSSQGIPLLCPEEADTSHGHTHHHTHTHDPHYWLDPALAAVMAENICRGLQEKYPQYEGIFQENLAVLSADLQALEDYGRETLSQLSHRQLITFHDGFSYLAEAFDLTILEAIEEEAGSEASAKTLKRLTTLIRQNDIPGIFTEKNGSSASARILSAETGVAVHCLDMAISGSSYFEAMYHNLATLKEALQ